MTLAVQITGTVLFVLCTARITRLLTRDAVTDWLRILIHRRREDGLLAYFSTCAWCVSFWVALATVWVLIWQTGMSWWLYLPLALAASHITGLLAGAEEDDQEIVIEERVEA